jgi:hypothetical protein
MPVSAVLLAVIALLAATPEPEEETGTFNVLHFDPPPPPEPSAVVAVPEPSLAPPPLAQAPVAPAVPVEVPLYVTLARPYGWMGYAPLYASPAWTVGLGWSGLGTYGSVGFGARYPSTPLAPGSFTRPPPAAPAPPPAPRVRPSAGGWVPRR